MTNSDKDVIEITRKELKKWFNELLDINEELESTTQIWKDIKDKLNIVTCSVCKNEVNHNKNAKVSILLNNETKIEVCLCSDCWSEAESFLISDDE